MFEYFNKAEAVLKTVCSYRFAMAHKDSPEAYLDRDSYRADAGYRKKIDTLIGDFEKVLCRSKKWNSDYKRTTFVIMKIITTIRRYGFL